MILLFLDDSTIHFNSCEWIDCIPHHHGVCRHRKVGKKSRQLILSPMSKTKKMWVFLATVPLSEDSNSLIFYAPVKPNRVKKSLRRGASSGAFRGRLRRASLTSRGGRMVARRGRATNILIGSSILCNGAACQYPTLQIRPTPSCRL